jgi:hypothetical protein
MLVDGMRWGIRKIIGSLYPFSPTFKAIAETPREETQGLSNTDKLV